MFAQQAAVPVMGTVATKDALVTGGLEVKGERARLMSNTSVTANDHTAQVKLERGARCWFALPASCICCILERGMRCCLGWIAGRLS